MRYLLGVLALAASIPAQAAIPATPVMSVYEFNGPLEVPYYNADSFARSGATSSAGTLTQGTSVIPCLVIRNGEPLTDKSGTPYVGFEVVVDPRKATRSSTETFKRAVAERKSMKVQNHHCPSNVKNVVNVRNLYALEKAPFFDPPRSGGAGSPGGALIIHYVAKTLYGTLNWGLSPQRAIDLPNFGSLNGPSLLEEKRFPTATVDALRTRGAEVREQNMTSGLQAIMRGTVNGKPVLLGGADPRREGLAVGDPEVRP